MPLGLLYSYRFFPKKDGRRRLADNSPSLIVNRVFGDGAHCQEKRATIQYELPIKLPTTNTALPHAIAEKADENHGVSTSRRTELIIALQTERNAEGELNVGNERGTRLRRTNASSRKRCN